MAKRIVIAYAAGSLKQNDVVGSGSVESGQPLISVPVDIADDRAP